MKPIFFLFFLFAASIAHSQGLKKYGVAETGSVVYMYCAPKWDVDLSEDSSKVYTAECKKDDLSHGVIFIKLLHPVSDLKVAEQMLIDYMDYLKLNFEIISATGYGKGHLLNGEDNTRGVLDYWTDADKNAWKVKGFTDGKQIAVLYAYSNKPLPEPRINVFLESFRFPD